MPALVGAHGLLHDRRFEVGSELVVGREGQDLTVDDSEISRRHAVFRSSGGILTVEDLGSRNGTFVNEQRVAGVVAMAHGDVVRVGATSFRVDTTPVSAVPAPPASSPAKAAGVPLASEPAQPFGTFSATDVAGHPRRAAASRQLVPELIAILAVIATAALLVLYFALR